MAIRTTAASHADTLPTLFLVTPTEDSNTWQHNNIDIAQGVDHFDVNQQNDTQYSMRICSNNLQPLGMLTSNHSTNKGNTGQPDALQRCGPGN